MRRINTYAIKWIKLLCAIALSLCLLLSTGCEKEQNMSTGILPDNVTTAEEIIVQYGGSDDIPQDDGEELVKIEDEEEE